MRKKKKKINNMPVGEIISNISYIISYLFKINKGLFFLRLPLLLLQTVSSLVTIFFISLIINEITYGGNIKTVLLFVVGLSVGNFIVSILKKILTMYDSRELEKTIIRIKYQLGKTVADMPFNEIEQPRMKDFISLAQSSDSFTNIIEYITQFVGAIISVLTYSTIVLVVQPWILILIAASITFQIIINKVKLNQENKWRIKQMPAIRKLWYIEGLLCDLRYGKELRVNQLKNWLINKGTNHYEKECIPIIKSVAYEGNGLSFISQILKIGENIVIYLLLAYKVVYKNIKVGDFTLYLASTANLTSSLSNLIDSISDLMRSGIFAKELRYCINLSNEKRDLFGNKTVSNDNLSIEFRNVTFKYPNSDNMVLKNVSFKIDPGEKLSIVGINGSGKSTIVKLICRFYEPIEGDILIGGINSKELSKYEYSRLLGVVFQDFQLFSFSVLENITIGMEVKKKNLKQSIQNSGLNEKINSLPEKENTSISKEFDEQGVEFSGGEGQKLAISRAIYKNAPIIILDEPTASLDPIAEYEIYKQFDSLSKGKTAIYISHRLASTRFTDKIAVLQDGILCEFGSHTQLINIDGGVYRKMFNIQTQHYK